MSQSGQLYLLELIRPILSARLFFQAIISLSSPSGVAYHHRFVASLLHETSFIIRLSYKSGSLSPFMQEAIFTQS